MSAGDVMEEILRMVLMLRGCVVLKIKRRNSVRWQRIPRSFLSCFTMSAIPDFEFFISHQQAAPVQLPNESHFAFPFAPPPRTSTYSSLISQPNRKPNILHRNKACLSCRARKVGFASTNRKSL